MTTIQCTAAQHGATINDLAERGLIDPVEFTAPDGVRRIANSMWAMHDWLTAIGYYKQPGSAPIIYHLSPASPPDAGASQAASASLSS